MEKITFINSNGIEIEAYPSANYTLQRITGVSQLGVAFEMEKGYLQDGAFYLNSTLDLRIMSIDIAIIGTSLTDLIEKRRFIEQVFNPKLGLGVLYYDNGVTEYKINCGVSTALTITEKSPTINYVNVILTAPIPFWLDTEENELQLEDFLGGLIFPLSLPTVFAESSPQGTVTNSGDVETPVIVEFQGPAENPKIEVLETGEYIEVTTTLTDVQKLVIDTAYDHNTVTLVEGTTETSAFNLININSTFFKLVVGDSTIKFTSTGSGDDPKVSVIWNNRYIGA